MVGASTGDPAVVDVIVFRPVALRPRLSAGLPFFSRPSFRLTPELCNCVLTECRVLIVAKGRQVCVIASVAVVTLIAARERSAARYTGVRQSLGELPDEHVPEQFDPVELVDSEVYAQ